MSDHGHGGGGGGGFDFDRAKGFVAAVILTGFLLLFGVHEIGNVLQGPTQAIVSSTRGALSTAIM